MEMHWYLLLFLQLLAIQCLNTAPKNAIQSNTICSNASTVNATLFSFFFFLKLVQFEKALFHLYIESRHILLIYLYKTFADNYF